MTVGGWVGGERGEICQVYEWCGLRRTVWVGRALGPRGVVGRAAGVLAQFRAMSGQLEVYHGALCTAPVSLNLSHCNHCSVARTTDEPQPTGNANTQPILF